MGGHILVFWNWFVQLLNANQTTLHSLLELVKLLGSFASFFAVYKISRIEKNYIFKGTIPTINVDIEKALTQLNQAVTDIDAFRPVLNEALNCLHADAKSLRRKVRGDSKNAVNDLLIVMRKTGLGRRFWEKWDVVSVDKIVLLDIYGRGHGLLRALKNDVGDMKWGAK